MSEFRVEILGRKAPKPNKRRRVVSDRAAVTRGNPGFLRSALRVTWWLVKPRRPTWALGAVAFVLIVYGTPHMLVTTNCTGTGTPGQRCFECRYLGVQGVRSHVGQNWNCPVIAMLPVNWRVAARQLGIQ